MSGTHQPWYHVAVVGLMLAVGLLYAYCAPPADAQTQPLDYEWREYVRVTYYVLPGFMASGQEVHTGAAACSYGYPMGSRLRFPDGWIVTCLDRGYLGRSRGWVDVWAPSLAWGRRYVTGAYGDYAWVEVLRWGWGEPEEFELVPL